MKVLQVLNSLDVAGSQTMIMNYYRAFDKEKCQMDFVVYKIDSGGFYSEAEEMGASIFLLERPTWKNVIRFIKEFSRIIKNHGPYDAVHVHSWPLNQTIIAAKLAGVKKIIVHAHSTEWANKRTWLFNILVDLIHVKRLSCGEVAGHALYGKREFTIINNAIETDKYIEASGKDYRPIKQERFGDKKVVGYMGRLSKAKNIPFVLSLAKAMKETRPDIVFALYGKGIREEAIKERIKAEGLEQKVLMMGFTDDPAAAYQTFDALILPSFWEGFSIVLIEAQVSGIHCFVSESVAKESDLKAGLIDFLPLDIELWKNKLIAYLDNPDDKTHKIPEEILDRYNIKKRWKDLYNIYAS